MLTNGRHGIDYVCALAIAFLFPLSLRFPPLVALAVPGMIGVYFLWFAREYWLLAVSSMLALIGVVMWRGTMAGIVLIAGMIVPTMVMAILRRRGSGVTTAVTAATVIPVIAIAVNYDFFARLLQFLSLEIRQRAIATPMPGIYTLDQQRFVLDTMNRLADKLPYYFPASVLCLIVALFSVGLLAGNYLVRSRGIYARPIQEFSFWKLPEGLAIPLGIAAIMVLTNQSVLTIIGWNALLLLAVLYSICGLSLIEYVMRRRRFPLAAKIAIYLFLFLTQLVAGILLPLAALFDSKFDFRKIRAKQLG